MLKCGTSLESFDKTSGGYLGHLKPFFGATKYQTSPYVYSRFLMSKTNFENLIFPIPYSTPNKGQKISLREPEIATTLLDI